MARSQTGVDTREVPRQALTLLYNALVAHVLLVIAAWLAAQSPVVPKTAAAPHKTDPALEAALSLERKIRDAALRGQQARNPSKTANESIVLLQDEINSYLKLSPAVRLPAGVNGLDLQLDQGGKLTLKANVDLDQIKKQASQSSTFNPLMLLSGQVPFTINGRLDSKDGFGSFVLNEVWLGPAPIPASVVSQFVKSSTRTAKNPEGFDMLAPFRLPYSIRRIRLKSGQAILEY